MYDTPRRPAPLSPPGSQGRPLLPLRPCSAQRLRLVSVEKLPPRVNPEEFSRVLGELQKVEEAGRALRRDNEQLGQRVSDLERINCDLANRAKEYESSLKLHEALLAQSKSQPAFCECHSTIQQLQRRNKNLNDIIQQLSRQVSLLQGQADFSFDQKQVAEPPPRTHYRVCIGRPQEASDENSRISAQESLLSALRQEVEDLKQKFAQDKAGSEDRTTVQTKQVCLLSVGQSDLNKVLHRLGMEDHAKLESKGLAEVYRELSLENPTGQQPEPTPLRQLSS